MAEFGKFPKGVSFKKLYSVYCLVLVCLLIVLYFSGYDYNLLIWIGITCLISGIVMWILAEILVRAISRSYPKRNNRTKWLLAGLLIILSTTGVLVFIYVYRDYSFDPYRESDRTAENINRRVIHLKVKPSGIKLANRQISSTYPPSQQLRFNFQSVEKADEPKSQYLISINDKGDIPDYLFNIKEYTIETGGDLDLIPTRKICEFIDQVYDEKEPILEAIRKFPIDLSFGRGPAVVSLNATEFFVELMYVLIKLYKMSTSHVEVLIKGYADGQIADWEEPLLLGRYEYREIPIYPKAIPDSKNPIDYVRSPQFYIVREYYTNRDLPNLRAMFVMKDFIEPFLRSCKTSRKIEAHVIDGHEFKEIDMFKRKAQIYVLLY